MTVEYNDIKLLAKAFFDVSYRLEITAEKSSEHLLNTSVKHDLKNALLESFLLGVEWLSTVERNNASNDSAMELAFIELYANSMSDLNKPASLKVLDRRLYMMLRSSTFIEGLNWCAAYRSANDAM